VTLKSYKHTSRKTERRSACWSWTVSDSAFLAKCSMVFHNELQQYTSETKKVSCALIGAVEPPSKGQKLIVLVTDSIDVQLCLAKPGLALGENGGSARRLGYYLNSKATFNCDVKICKLFFGNKGEQVDLMVYTSDGAEVARLEIEKTRHQEAMASNNFLLEQLRAQREAQRVQASTPDHNLRDAPKNEKAS